MTTVVSSVNMVADPAEQALAQGGWRTWPWATIVFLHVVFLLANVSPDAIPFPLDEVANVQRAITASDEGMVGRRIAFLVLGGIASYCLVKFDYRRLRVKGVLGALMLAFFIWSCLSWSWAEDVPLATRKIFIFVLLWLGAGWTALRLQPRDLLRFGFVSNMLTLVTCFGIELVFGRLGGYRFAGLYHPNETGQCLVVATTAGLALATRASGKAAIGYVLAAAISFLFLLLTGSRTSLLSAGCAITAYWVIVSFANRRAARVLVFTISIVLVAMCLGYVFVGPDVGKDILNAMAMGRQDSDVTTLTERTPLWHALIDHYIMVRPLLGYGYGAFWSTKHLVAMSLLKRGIVYFHSHSGYLEMALSIGVVGAAVHVLTLILGTKQLLGEFLRTNNEGCAFGAALIVTLMLSMFTEPTNMSSYLMPTFIDMAFLMHCAFVVRPMVGVVQQRFVGVPTTYGLAASL